MLENQGRTLPEVFRELQATRDASYIQASRSRQFHKKKTLKIAVNKMATKTIIVAVISVLSFSILISSTGYIFAANIEDKKEPEIVGAYEENKNAINVENIISENISIITSKKLITEEREIKYKTIYKENKLLPENEEIIIQEGINGKEIVTCIKIYDNDEYIDETILDRRLIQEAKNKIIQVGTSQYLKKYNVHIGDSMYLLKESSLRKEPNQASESIDIIPERLDVKLLDVSDQYCKVSFNEKEGYIKTKNLTSAEINPEFVEECRVLKIKQNLDPDMELNKPSGLSLQDFKKVLSGNKEDKYKIFENNAEVFYNIERKYNINGIFLASVGIHESNWGKSFIAKEKNNLFGYGAYDRNPYELSYEFESYKEGIEIVAKALVKFYINKPGTEIYDGEIAKGSYYNGSTITAINIRYASDENWSNRVYAIMEKLYNRLK